MAVLRSRSSSKVARISASVAGIITAAPMPSRARVAMSNPGVGAYAAASELHPKMVSPSKNIRRWPMRSPSVPVPSSRPDSTSG